MIVDSALGQVEGQLRYEQVFRLFPHFYAIDLLVFHGRARPVARARLGLPPGASAFLFR